MKINLDTTIFGRFDKTITEHSVLAGGNFKVAVISRSFKKPISKTALLLMLSAPNPNIFLLKQ